MKILASLECGNADRIQAYFTDERGFQKMKQTKYRNAIREGSKIKIKNIISGVAPNGTPFWQTCINLYTTINGETVVFDYLWLICNNKCEFNVGDWVEIEKIIGFKAVPTKSNKGANIVFKYLYCNIVKANFKKEDEQNGN